MSIWGPLIGAAGTLGGALLGRSNDTTMQQHGLDFAKHQFSVSHNFQNKLAREGVSMRMADIMRASEASGINPLAIMGQPGAQSSPVSVGTPHFDAQQNDKGRLARQLGQDIGRAVEANNSLDRRYKQAQIDLVKAQADNIKGQGGRANQDQTGPSVPVPPGYKTNALTKKSGGVIDGIVPGYSLMKVSDNKILITPSEASAERLEEHPQKYQAMLQAANDRDWETTPK